MTWRPKMTPALPRKLLQPVDITAQQGKGALDWFGGRHVHAGVTQGDDRVDRAAGAQEGEVAFRRRFALGEDRLRERRRGGDADAVLEDVEVHEQVREARPGDSHPRRVDDDLSPVPFAVELEQRLT